MSQENADVVRANFEAWNAGNVDAMGERYDPNIIARPAEGWPEPGPFVGRDAVIRQWKRQREDFQSEVLVPLSDFIEIADRVVVRFIWRGRTIHGPESKVELTGVYTVRKGRIFYIEYFWDHAEALETLGISE